MPTRSNRFSRIIVLRLFTLLFFAMVKESDQIPTNSPSECQRKCADVARTNTSTQELCLRGCLNRKTVIDRSPSPGDNILQPTDCPDSTQDQSVLDWTPSRISESFGQYENSSSWYVNMSWSPMNDTIGNRTGILVRMVIISLKDGNPVPTNCFVFPPTQTFLRVNISSFGYQYPDAIFVNILALPYRADISDAQRMLPPKLSAPTPTTTPATLKPTTTPEALKPTTTAETLKPTTTAAPSKGPTNKCNNEYGKLVWYPDKIKAKPFLGDNNTISYVNISWSPLTDPTVTWKGYMISLFIGDIRTLGSSPGMRCFLLPKNQTYFIVDSSRGWKHPCSSISVNVTAYPRPRFEVADLGNIFPSKPCGPPGIYYETFTISSSGVKQGIVQTVFLSVGGVAGVLIVVAVIFFYRRWKRQTLKETPGEGPKRFKYHAFIIYSMLDSQWVDTTLVPTLESYGFRCCIHWKDFLPGRVFAESIVESVYNSFKIIAVVSSHFMSSNTCDFELQHAMTRLMANRDDCLIVIKFDNAGIERLPAPILDRSYIDFTRGTDRSTWESKLAGILSKALIEDDSCRTSTTSTTDNNNRFSEGISTASEDKDLTCSCQIE
ncbi:unnamed protein product [Porites lobata]|uniref:TIR domain-containing protein n=1 Tax=Porites lobata TaxID=104759 RepID=A0ABN8Q4P1_9CNID|nr:unnamed protein product [Porites lobata]